MFSWRVTGIWKGRKRQHSILYEVWLTGFWKGSKKKQLSSLFRGWLGFEKKAWRSNIPDFMEGDRVLKGKQREATIMPILAGFRKGNKLKQHSCLYGEYLSFERKTTRSNIHVFMESDWVLKGKEGEATFTSSWRSIGLWIGSWEKQHSCLYGGRLCFWKVSEQNQHLYFYGGWLDFEMEARRSNIHVLMQGDWTVKRKWNEVTFLSLWRMTELWKGSEEKQHSFLHGGGLRLERKWRRSNVHVFMKGDWYFKGKEVEATFMSSWKVSGLWKGSKYKWHTWLHGGWLGFERETKRISIRVFMPPPPNWQLSFEKEAWRINIHILILDDWDLK